MYTFTELQEAEQNGLLYANCNEEKIYDIVDYLDMKIHIYNFPQKYTDGQLDEIFRISKHCSGIMQNNGKLCYNFDTINYAFFAYLSENEWNTFIDLFHSVSPYHQADIRFMEAVELANTYSDLEEMFEIL